MTTTRVYQAVTTDEGVDLLVEQLLADNRMVAFDIETGYSSVKPAEKRALDTYHPDFFVVGFSITNDESWARYIPLRHDSERPLDPKRTWEAFRPVLEKLPVLAHNFQFELRALKQLAVQGDADAPIIPTVMHDSMLLSHVRGKNRFHGLKALSKEELGVDQTEFKTLFQNQVDQAGKKIPVKNARFNTLGLTQEVIEYACDDAALCLELFKKMWPDLDAGQQRIYKIEMEICRLMSEAGEFGIGVDWAGIRQAHEQYKGFRDNFDVVVREAFAAKSVDPEVKEFARTANFGSPMQMRSLLYDKLGMTTTRTTTTGALSTDAIALEALSRKEPAIRLLLSLREIDNLGRRCDKWLKEYYGARDLRIHPTFSQSQVVSGRFSANDPAVQQLPKDWLWSVEWDEEGNYLTDGENGHDYWKGNFRKFICAQEDHYLLTFDYCVAPETRILTSDLEWKTADSVSVGDELIGFPEKVHEYKRGTEKHAWERTTVTRVSYPEHKCFRISLSDGRSVTASEGHLWLATGTPFSPKTDPNLISVNGSDYRPHAVRKWVRTEDLIPGTSKICHGFPVWEELQTAEEKVDHAYLAGLLDGEGWLSDRCTIGFGQVAGPVWDKFVSLSNKYGYSLGGVYQNKPSTPQGQSVLRTYFSGRDTAIKVMARTQPVRLFPRHVQMWEGYRTWSHYSVAPTVVSVEPVGVQKTVSIETTTHTFIAEGLMSHNCQQELRVLAGLTGEPALLKGFAEGLDPHKLTASLMFNKPIDEVTKDERQAGKGIGFGILYGMGPKRLSEQLAVDKDEATRLFNLYKSQFTKVAHWDSTSRELGLARHYVTTWLGRKVPLWQSYDEDSYVRSGAERLAVNAQIQGGAADYTKLAMLRSWAMLRKAGLWGPGKVMLTMNQHDSLTFECHNSVDPNVVRAILQEAVVFDVLSMFPNLEGVLTFPTFEVDWELGRTWGGSAGWDMSTEAVWSEEAQTWHVAGTEPEVPVVFEERQEKISEPDVPALPEIVLSDVVDEVEVEESVTPVEPEVFVIRPSVVTKKTLSDLLSRLTQHAGSHKVVLRIQDKFVPMKCSVSEEACSSSALALVTGEGTTVERVSESGLGIELG